MQSEKSSRAPFDDRAALEELEQLQRSIQEYRRRREEAEGAFERFVGSFKKPAAAAEKPAAGPAAAPLPGFHIEVAPPASDKVAVVPARADSAPAVVAAPVVAPAPAPARPVVAPVPAPARPVVAPVPAPARPVIAPAPAPAPTSGATPAFEATPASRATPAFGAPTPPVPVAPVARTTVAAPPDVPSPGSSPSLVPIAPIAEGTKAGAADIGGSAASRAWTSADQIERESGPAPAVSLPDNFFASATGRSSGNDASVGTAPTSESGGRRFPGWIPWAFVATAAALISAVFMMRPGQVPAAPDAASAPSTVETPVAAPPAAPVATPTPSPAPAAAAAPAPPAEIRTLRSVWVRVTVDGRREIERELEADARIPLPAGRSFVIRAGDAGAVRFLLNGKDQGALGPDAQVVTRTFTAAVP